MKWSWQTLRPVTPPRAYWSIFRLRLSAGLQYRAAALAGMATQLVWGFLLIMVFQAFFKSASVAPPMTVEQLTTYIWLQQSFLALIMLWFRDNELFDLITSGAIAYELCRPADLYGLWFAKLLAQRMAATLLRSAPIFFIALVLLPEPYRMKLPPDWKHALLFVCTMLLGLLVLVAISMLIYISVFVTLSPTGSLLLFGVVGEFMAGLILPIPLMPDAVQQVVYLFPFHYTADFPFRIFTGHLSTDEAIRGMAGQALWLVGLLGTGVLLMRAALRRVVVQGG